MSLLSYVDDYDFDTGIACVTARGHLDHSGASRLRSAALRCFAEFPLALCVDLTEVTTSDLPALSELEVLPLQPDAPAVVICAPADTVTGQAVRRTRLTVVQDRAAAFNLASSMQTDGDRMHTHLPAEVSSAADARRLVARACIRWQLPYLAAAAQLIVTELVSNAVRHARSDVDLTVALRQSYLHLNVRDRSQTLPAIGQLHPAGLEQSRGLRLVEAMADTWGTVLYTSGKTVWATMRRVSLH